jgi:PilZ domain
MPQGEERRRHRRIRLEGRAVGRATVLAEFRVVGLWESGGTLELPLPLALGSLCDLTLSLGPGSVDLKARVVQVESVGEPDKGYRVNVDFITMDADDQALLYAFLDREGGSSP